MVAIGSTGGWRAGVGGGERGMGKQGKGGAGGAHDDEVDDADGNVVGEAAGPPSVLLEHHCVRAPQRAPACRLHPWCAVYLGLVQQRHLCARHAVQWRASRGIAAVDARQGWRLGGVRGRVGVRGGCRGDACAVGVGGGRGADGGEGEGRGVDGGGVWIRQAVRIDVEPLFDLFMRRS